MEFSQVILDSLSGDRNRRVVAERNLESFKEQNFVLYLTKLTEEVTIEERTPEHRLMAAIMFKNAITGQSERTIQEGAFKWLNIPREQRIPIKSNFLRCLNSEQTSVRSGAAKAIAQIACIELPTNEWIDLIDILLNNVSTENPFNKQATLEALGIICEGINPEVLASQSNKILNTIVSGLAPGLPIEVSKAAISALLSSLAFIKSDFKNNDHRNYIMKVICEATQFPHKDIQYIAMQCLVSVADKYYPYILPYIESIFTITQNVINKQTDEIALQAIEFWSTICEKEAVDVYDYAVPGDSEVNHQIISKVFPHLFPSLALALTKQDDDVEDDEWNVATAATACITLLSQVLEDNILPVLFPFVSQNLKSADWRFRDAATIAFGSILEYVQNDASTELVKSAIPIFLETLKTDENNRVKDTTAWAIAKAAEFHPTSIKDQFVPVLETLVGSLNADANVASQACYALLIVIQLFDDFQSHPLLPTFFSPLLEALVRASERPDGDLFKLRITAYEAINALIENAPRDPSVSNVIFSFVELLIDRIAKTFTMPMEMEEKAEFQSYLCSVLQTITIKLDKSIEPFSHQLLEVYFRVIDFIPNQLPGDPLLAVSTLLTVMPDLVIPKIDQIKKYIIISLTNYEVSSVFVSGLTLLGTVSSSLEKNFFLMDNGQFVTHLLHLLQISLSSAKIKDSIKPTILNSFGEIATAIGDHFVNYLPAVMTLLNAASQTTVDMDDEDQVEYLVALREAILETYTMIIQSLKENSLNAIAPYITDILNFINVIWMDKDNLSDQLIQSIIGIIGDICDAFGESVKPIMTQPIVNVIISKGLQSTNQQLKRTAQWAKSVIPK